MSSRHYINSSIFLQQVAILWAFNTLHVALSTHALYHYLIDLFSNYTALYDIVWSFKLQILFNMVIILGVQVIYAVRIWKLGHHFHQILPWFVVLCVAVTGVYINSLLAMLNSCKDHHVPTNCGLPVAKVLKFESQDSGVHNEEVNISIPMQSAQSLDHVKEGLDFQRNGTNVKNGRSSQKA
ncbi:hypothetical protein EV421DRAFT_1914354 [Armillaria borealis]|uniref:Uncharacterized protein n=1 Tax=Armillaria borealis TaxID=47425 RepID=A0AA39MCD5_9AGAR|nr:hypothetical protein EV421DRAFT_1914354 [Armillaria borealis]